MLQAIASFFSRLIRLPYFDPAGEELLATYLLAAAAGAEPVTAVYRWVTNDRDDTPVSHLKDAGHLDLSAAAESTMHLPDRQRAGVFGTAAKIVAWMADPRLRAWVVRPSDGRPRLDVAALLEEGSGATLYSLSKEGVGSAGALTGALTTTFLTEAERRGQVSPSGRLAVPVVAVLDEVANVCRWRDLPDRYSHYGCRGIVCACYLQSWSQGVECWGREGMKKLWGAANIRVYGGGTHEAEFLEDVQPHLRGVGRAGHVDEHGPGHKPDPMRSWPRQQRALSIPVSPTSCAFVRPKRARRPTPASRPRSTWPGATPAGPRPTTRRPRPSPSSWRPPPGRPGRGWSGSARP